MTDAPNEPVYFATADELRTWLEAHGETAAEVWVGFHKRRTGRPSLTWPEAVDQALCFGWIDGVRRGVDTDRYVIRFTPRRPRSVWSVVNVERAGELIERGLMRPAGLAAFERRTETETPAYSYEQRAEAALPDEFARALRADETAWAFFQAQPASYRKAAIWWVTSAKKEETRRKRLATLIADSAQRRTMPPLTRRSGTREL